MKIPEIGPGRGKEEEKCFLMISGFPKAQSFKIYPKYIPMTVHHVGNTLYLCFQS
jgi:hypothetical protein